MIYLVDYMIYQIQEVFTDSIQDLSSRLDDMSITGSIYRQYTHDLSSRLDDISNTGSIYRQYT